MKAALRRLASRLCRRKEKKIKLVAWQLDLAVPRRGIVRGLPAASIRPRPISSDSGVVATAMPKVKNPLLLPNEVGKGRPPVADLPPESFSYGKRTTSDGLSTGQALGEWAVFKPNIKDLPGRDYMALNRMAIKHGSGQCYVSAFHPESSSSDAVARAI